jgi:hypothetical protein
MLWNQPSNHRILMFTESQVHAPVTPLLFNRTTVLRSLAMTCETLPSQLAPYGLQPRRKTSYDRSCRSTQCGGLLVAKSRYFIQHHTNGRHSVNLTTTFLVWGHLSILFHSCHFLIQCVPEVPVAYPALPYFSTLSHKQHDFRKKS